MLKKVVFMRKVILLFGIVTFISLIFSIPAHAAEDGQIPDSTNYKAPQQAQYIFENLGFTLVCEGVGHSLIPGLECGSHTATGYKLFGQVPGGGAIGMTNTAMLAMYDNPPVSTNLYLASLGSSLGIQPAYAQNVPSTVSGSGSQVLVVILNLWTVSRNLSYLLFIIIFIIVGFMVMFRHRINPQTVVTIQLALPRLVIGLILTTFSYFIASLIVDLSFVGTGLVALFFTQAFPDNGTWFGQAILGSSQVLGTNGGLQSVASAGNVPGLFSLFFFRTAVFGNTLGGFVELFSGWFPSFVPPSQGIPGVLNWILSTATAPIGGAIVGGVVGILVIAIIVVAALIQCIRLVWGLLQAYINILVFTILGPLIILGSSLPGQEKMLGVWWRNLLGNVLAFPAVFAAFLFAAAILDNVNSPNNYASGAMPLFGGIDTSLLRAMLSLGIVLGTPAIPGMMRKMVGAHGIGDIAATAGAAAGIGGAVVGVPVGSMAGRAASRAWGRFRTPTI